ncbi:hypothetical protein CPB85DRAFT_1005599 [Mucidula mucida]|nr:hypothetical protein CPB85DRAFT_1005599 [Mucidula mucida]
MSCHLCQDIAHDISPLHSGLSDGTFAPFLSSNDPPSDAAFSRITNDILPLLSSHIEHVKSHTSKGSSDELAALETLLENYKLIVSPYRLLPTEILWQIFHACTEFRAESLKRNSRIMSAGPSNIAWRLAQVCRTWRSAALSYGPIWSSFTLRLIPSYATSPHSLSILKTVLNRSGHSPLNIVLETISGRSFFPRDWDRNTRVLEAQSKLVGLIYSQSHRWQSITLHLERAEDVEDLDNAEPTDLDFLQSFTDCPRLSHLQLDGIQTVQTMVSSSLPWKQITNFAISTPHTAPIPVAQFVSCLRVLEKCTSAITFSFTQHCFGRDASYVAATPIVLPILEELHTTDPLIYNNLSLPALRIIKAGSKFRDASPDLLTALDGLITRSDCAESIRRIDFVGFPIRGLLLQILTRTRNLEQLSLKGLCDIDDQSKTEIGVITQFIGGMKVSEELPKLKLLHASDKNEVVRRTRVW